MHPQEKDRSQNADDSSEGMNRFFMLVHETKQAQLAAINLEQQLFKILATRCQPQADEQQESSQYLHGNRLLLPHFTEPREYSPERARIIKLVWGDNSSTPPIVKWADINILANTGYNSFSDAFKAQVKDLFSKIAYGKYQLRRNAQR